MCIFEGFYLHLLIKGYVLGKYAWFFSIIVESISKYVFYCVYILIVCVLWVLFVCVFCIVQTLVEAGNNKVNTDTTTAYRRLKWFYLN